MSSSSAMMQPMDHMSTFGKSEKERSGEKGRMEGGGGGGRDGEVTREAETELFSKMRSEEASDGPRVY